MTSISANTSICNHGPHPRGRVEDGRGNVWDRDFSIIPAVLGKCLGLPSKRRVTAVALGDREQKKRCKHYMIPHHLLSVLILVVAHVLA